MKSVLLTLTTLLVSLSAYGTSCDLGLVDMESSFGPVSYNDDVFTTFWDRGYDAKAVEDTDEASDYQYTAVVSINCSPYPFMFGAASAVTTLKVYRSSDHKKVFERSSEPQITFGSCSVELLSLIEQIPVCE